MSEETQARRSYGFWVAVALPLALLLYTLSVGPAAYVVVRTGKGMEMGRLVYAPLVWLADNTPLRKPLEWYAQQWQMLAAGSVPTAPPPPTPSPAPPP
jgi:hypothetical protein